MSTEPARTLPIAGGLHAIVDAEDYEMLSWWSWHIQKSNRIPYVSRRLWPRGGVGPRTLIRLHRVIMLPDPHEGVDHINGDTLDNRRCNLRICNQSQNGGNARPTAKKTASRYKGVCWCKDTQRWRAMIMHHRKHINIGRYDDEIDAALAYDVAAIERFGEFARPNFLHSY